MANVSSSNGLEKRPKLRFPGFDEPWRVERLSDFADRVTRKNSKNETDLPLKMVLSIRLAISTRRLQVKT